MEAEANGPRWLSGLSSVRQLHGHHRQHTFLALYLVDVLADAPGAHPEVEALDVRVGFDLYGVCPA